MSPRKIRLLIVAAYAKELASLCCLGSRHFVIKDDVAYLAAGIGPVAATFGLTHFLEDYRPEKIIGIGTAGVINKKFKIGEIVTGKCVSTDTATNKNRTTLCPSCPLRPLSPAIASVNIFSPQEISKTEALRVQLARAGHDVENLEAYAFAFVAKKFRVSFVSLLGLTNYVGPKGHKEWKKNEQKVCHRLAKEIKKII